MCLKYRIKSILEVLSSCMICKHYGKKPYQEPCLFCSESENNFEFRKGAFIELGKELEEHVNKIYKDDIN